VTTGLVTIVSVIPAIGAKAGPLESVRKFVITEHDLYPESIAHDPVSGDYFLGSMSGPRILRINPDGSYRDFLAENVDGLEGLIGLKADPERRVLWACGGRFTVFAGSTDADARTGVFQFDLDSGALIASHTESQESPFHICNDLALAPAGYAYVTTTLIGRLYHAAPDLSEVLTLDQLDDGSNNNGITLGGPGGDRLFVTVDRAIWRYDLGTDRVVEIEVPEDAGLVGPDGIYYVSGSLVVVQPRANGVIRLDLDDDETRVIRSTVLAEGHPDFAYPTTGVMVGDTLVFVASSYADRPRQPGVTEQHGDVFIHAVPVR
jgi:sugar lactone lactonase YvrE